MIFINKAGHPIPNILLIEGEAKKQEHINDFEANEATFRLSRKRSRKFYFDNKIYGHPTVKTLLQTIQNNKCCFCEAKYKHVASGDVEHFRPKAEFSQGHGNLLHRPGYFWLAYDWNNLLVSCEICNRRGKGFYFPLKNPHRRFTNHLSNIQVEEPWFINPSLINPEVHIRFYKEVPEHITFEGAKTISYLELDREELNEMRLSKLNDLKALEDSYLASIGSAIENRIRDNFFNRLRAVLLHNGEYYSMVRSNFGAYIPHL
ncbi:hypothetical protein ACNQGL_08610 [Flavobacterium sp. LB3P21]|uniref:hypothetical protein n=1 Tax=Flavobacterium sp. LB3P21 TaxID=3401719 RepID=UPI003AAE798C